MRGRDIENPIKVFVLLGHGFGATNWQRRFSAGLIPGVNEQLPYGYFRAEDARWNIRYSEDKKESLLTEVSRRSLQRIIGFDLIHVWRNRHQLFCADIVWTHTEREHLAVLLLRRMRRKGNSPAVLAQCVWLFDLWPTLPGWKRRLYRALLFEAELVTTQSPENMEVANKLLTRDDCRAVKFGVGSGIKQLPFKGGHERPIRILSLGNDMHRDWETLIAAFGDRTNYFLRLASKSVPHNLILNHENVQLSEVKTAQELTDLYRWAHLVVVSLKQNLHASGITVLLEATLFGLPVVCTDTGGLRAYFSDDEISFVPLGDPHAMREAADSLVTDDDLRNLRVMKAQATLMRTNLTAQGFADQHRKLSETILFGTRSVAPKRDFVISTGNAAHVAGEECAHVPSVRR